MQTDSSDKYKMFRNFMANELGIGRDDIKAWTKEAIATQVEKVIGQINVNQIVMQTIEQRTREAIKGPSYNNGFSDALLKVVREAIASEIAGRIAFKNAESEEKA